MFINSYLFYNIIYIILVNIFLFIYDIFRIKKKIKFYNILTHFYNK